MSIETYVNKRMRQFEVELMIETDICYTNYIGTHKTKSILIFEAII